MTTILTIMLVALVAFTVIDYALGRANVNDPARLISSAVFAVLVAIFVRGL